MPAPAPVLCEYIEPPPIDARREHALQMARFRALHSVPWDRAATEMARRGWDWATADYTGGAVRFESRPPRAWEMALMAAELADNLAELARWRFASSGSIRGSSCC